MSNSKLNNDLARQANETKDTEIWTCFDDPGDQEAVPSKQSSSVKPVTSTKAPSAADSRKIIVPKASSAALRKMTIVDKPTVSEDSDTFTTSACTSMHEPNDDLLFKT
jgi:hypothetical protein